MASFRFGLCLISAFVAVSAAGNIGDKCKDSTGCPSKNAYCKIGSPSCGSGLCSCIPGYTLDKINGVCKRAATLGGACKDGDTCSTDNAECTNGQCACAKGYKTGPKGTDCVPATASLQSGGKCYDSVQCYYNLKCDNNACGCAMGYTSSNGYECRARTIGDSCSTNDDCSRAPNTVCSNGKCQCDGSYKLVTYMTSGTKTEQACIASGQSMVGEGQSCNTTVDARGQGTLCAQPYLCQQCDANVSKCGRVVGIAAGAADLKWSAMLAFLLALGALRF